MNVYYPSSFAGRLGEIRQNEIRARRAGSKSGSPSWRGPDRSSRSRAAAMIIEYSPLTWYAAIGTSKRSRACADQIEIRHRRLDHDHVGAFFQIELDLAHGLAPVGRVHLIAAPVAELRRGFGGFAERPVKHRGELGRVGQNRRVR